MSSNVRIYRDSDRASIIALAERFTSFDLPPWREKQAIDDANRAALTLALDRPGGDRVVYVAELGGVFAGFVHAAVRPDHFTRERIGYISDIAVDPSCEGQGVAGELLDEVLRWAEREGLAFLTLEVFDGNHRAMRLYEKHGFARDVVQYTRPVG